MIAYWSSVTCSKYSWSCGVFGSRSEQANSRSSISDLMSGKIKRDKKTYKIITTCTVKYSILQPSHVCLICPLFLKHVQLNIVLVV